MAGIAGFAGDTQASGIYGRNGYGECAYQKDCPVTSSDESILPSTPQTPVAPNPIWDITTNIPSGTIIKDPSVEVVVCLVQTVNGATTAVPVDRVGWVIMYVDNVRTAVQYNPDEKGCYRLDWNTVNYPGTEISVVYYDKNGVAIARKDTTIAYNVAGATRPIDGPAIPGSLQPETGQKDSFVLSPFLRKVFETIPYWLFLILLAITLRMLWQTIREINAADRLKKIIIRQRHIYEAKETFLSLAAHYLRTPVSTISGGVELLAPSLRDRPGVYKQLQATVATLATKIDGLIQDIQDDARTNTIFDQGKTAEETVRSIRTASFWTLIAGIILMCAVAEMLLISLTDINFDYVDVLTQVILDVAIAIFLLLSIRQAHLKRAQRQQLDQALAFETNLDNARNQFVFDAASTLSQSTSATALAIKDISAQKSTAFIQRGIDALNDVVRKFEIAAAIAIAPASSNEHSAVALIQLSRQILDNKQAVIAAKGLQVSLPSTEFETISNRGLLRYAISAVLDNAIKFNKDSGRLTISAQEIPGMIDLVIEDSGIGIAADALSDIFEPFVRATSVQEYNYQGLGLNLYLSQLIMGHLGGSIELASTGAGTRATIHIPIKL